MKETLNLSNYQKLNTSTATVELNSIKEDLILTIETSQINDDTGKLSEILLTTRAKEELNIKWLTPTSTSICFGNLLQNESETSTLEILEKVATNKLIPIFSIYPFQRKLGFSTFTWKKWSKIGQFIPRLFITRKERDSKQFTMVKLSLNSDQTNLRFDRAEQEISFNNIFHQENVRETTSKKEDWIKNLNKTLSLLKNEESNLSKVVMANTKDLVSKDPFDHLSLFNFLSGIHDSSKLTHFYLEDGPLSFMGFSPENLLLKNGNQISIDAIAGTRPRSKTKEKDLKLEQELRNSDKEQREHQEVIDSIAACTQTYGTITVQPQEVLKLSGLQHLKTPLKISSKEELNTDIMKLVRLLHPTPAVGGSPTVEAMELIDQLESFERGLYAGTLGLSYGEETRFIVAIRSLLAINNIRVTLYAGAGIVNGSEVTKEWDELETKFNSFFPSSLISNEKNSKEHSQAFL